MRERTRRRTHSSAVVPPGITVRVLSELPLLLQRPIPSRRRRQRFVVLMVTRSLPPILLIAVTTPTRIRLIRNMSSVVPPPLRGGFPLLELMKLTTPTPTRLHRSRPRSRSRRTRTRSRSRFRSILNREHLRHHALVHDIFNLVLDGRGPVSRGSNVPCSRGRYSTQ